MSEGVGQQQRRECVALAAALRSKIELVPKSGRCNCGGPATPDGQSQAVDDTKRAAQPERIQREFVGTHESTAVLMSARRVFMRNRMALARR